MNQSNKDQVWTNSRIAEVKKEAASAASKKGEASENLVVELCRMLEGVKDAWRAAPGCALDQTIKGDIVIELEDSEECFVLQVKSSQEAADKYLSLPAPVYNGRTVAKVPVIVTDSKSQWELLTELSENMGLSLKPSLKAAVDMIEKLKRAGIKDIPTGFIKPALATRLCRLGLVGVKNGEYYIV